MAEKLKKKWLKIAGMTANGKKWLVIAENYGKWLNMTEWLERALNCWNIWKWQEYGFKMLEMALNE